MNSECKSRRSHLQRRAMKKGVRITGADMRDIFLPLARHAQLTTRQLVAYGTRYQTITRARLGELWHATEGQRAHWLHRLNEDVLFANHLYVEDMHRLGAAAEELLIAQGLTPAGPWAAASRIGGKSAAPSRIIRLAHDHMASGIALDIEIGVRAAGLRFRSHIDILLNAPEATRLLHRPLRIPLLLDGKEASVEPDALFAIGNRIYALEADRGSESVTSVIARRIRAYREIVANRIIDDHFGIDNLTVLFATTSEIRMRHMMAEVARIARNGRSAMFAFRAEPEFAQFLRATAPDGRRSRQPWSRAGYDDLFIIPEPPSCPA